MKSFFLALITFMAILAAANAFFVATTPIALRTAPKAAISLRTPRVSALKMAGGSDDPEEDALEVDQPEQSCSLHCSWDETFAMAHLV